jgi:hypothetical protein
MYLKRRGLHHRAIVQSVIQGICNNILKTSIVASRVAVVRMVISTKRCVCVRSRNGIASGLVNIRAFADGIVDAYVVAVFGLKLGVINAS